MEPAAVSEAVLSFRKIFEGVYAILKKWLQKMGVDRKNLL
jgi:hypothetical protein